ncbi:arsenate reductase ArsC [Caldilinea sp.]|jgi:arsenate reductase|uniref:arsenate reductase ArsC n=1 Tax=Caldilinea sp. TaxID=2293560 RepID=UPI00262A51D9|nr:arsenate reductase ArsC [uncultured Caldilinea sp.]
MDRKIKVLFVCVHNSARSQMAEAFLNALYGDRFEAMSAGLEPGVLNPYVVRAMQEVGIDISNAKTKSVFELYKAGYIYSYVITVCDPEAAERCPIFPGVTKRLHWSFPDPSQAKGSDEEKMAMVRSVRDAIRQQIEAWAPTVAERALKV